VLCVYDLRASSYPGPEALYDYELFAVINHEGQIDNGHYTSFARFQDTVRVPFRSHHRSTSPSD
jgi:ubiquitin C-terminal hydrolase